MLPLTPWSCPQSRISRRGGSRTLGLRLIRTPLSPLSYAPASRAGGNRTHTVRIKSPPCCQLHHDPQSRSGVCVSTDVAATSLAPAFLVPVVALRIELSTTRLSAVSGPPALDYRFQVGHVGVEPRPSCSQNTRAPLCTSSRLSPVRTAGFEPAISWSPTTRDPRLRHVLIEYPVGESNPNPAGIRSPKRRSAGRGTVCANIERSGLGGARILLSGSSDRRYTVSATSPNKKARRLL